MTKEERRENMKKVRAYLDNLQTELVHTKHDCRKQFSNFNHLSGKHAVRVFQRARHLHVEWDDLKCRARHAHLLYNCLKGVPYLQVERDAYTWPNEDYLVRNLESAGIKVTPELVERCSNWLEQGKSETLKHLRAAGVVVEAVEDNI